MELRDMKTVFMLDRSAKFVDKCNEKFDITVREGPKQKKLFADKTIWTWCLEGVFEMHRILTDVYPRSGVQMRFAVADFMGKMLDTEWKDSFLTREELAKLIEAVTRPSATNTDITPIGGLTMAIEALAVETPKQKEFNYEAKYNEEKRTALNSEVMRVDRELKSLEPLPEIENNGNLVIYTRLNTEEDMIKLQQEVVTLITSRNKIANSPSNKTFCPITSLRLFIVNFYATGEKCSVKTHALEEHPHLPLLKIWVISRKATDMQDAIHSLLVDAFDLASTTVTKIPMKEDNRGSSNYDVELFHPSRVHGMLKEQKLIATTSKNANADSGVTYDTMRLAWTTAPKTKWSLFPHHGDSVPCTTVQAYSRPSACLTQFVRDGRCVMLDLERTTTLGMNMPDKLVSHLLIANRGRIFIQEIDFMQKGYADEKFIGELFEPDFVPYPEEKINLAQLKHMYSQMELKLIAKNRLNDDLTLDEQEKWNGLKHANIEKRFIQISRNIPMKAKDTFIFNDAVRSHLEPLITTITQTTLTEADFEKCRVFIMKLLQMRTGREFIISANTKIDECLVTNLEDPDEQMRVALVELAKHLMKYVKFSEMHEKVYKTFMVTLDVDKLLAVDVEDPDAADKKFVTFPFFGRLEVEKSEPKSSLERFLKRRWGNSSEEESKSNKEVEKPTRKNVETHPKEKPLIFAKEIKIDIFANICEMIERKEAKIRRDFVGREEHGNKAPLYPQLVEQRPASPSSGPTDRTDRIRNADRGGSGTPPPGRRPF
uniref:Protein asunder n=1 Tax=Caenorhabditis japonica TaxID=281687 RepID=A0A8R1HXN1_CAEJA